MVIDTVKEEKSTVTKPEKCITQPKSKYKLKLQKQSRTIIKKKMVFKSQETAIVKP